MPSGRKRGSALLNDKRNYFSNIIEKDTLFDLCTLNDIYIYALSRIRNYIFITESHFNVYRKNLFDTVTRDYDILNDHILCQPH